jgi:hypothetical protein
MREIDLQKLPAGEALRAILGAYNKLRPGEEIGVTIASYPAGLRMGLVEAGASTSSPPASPPITCAYWMRRAATSARESRLARALRIRPSYPMAGPPLSAARSAIILLSSIWSMADELGP